MLKKSVEGPEQKACGSRMIFGARGADGGCWRRFGGGKQFGYRCLGGCGLSETLGPKHSTPILWTSVQCELLAARLGNSPLQYLSSKAVYGAMAILPAMTSCVSEGAMA